MSRQNVIQQWGAGGPKQSVIQAPKTASPRMVDNRQEGQSPHAMHKMFTPSPYPTPTSLDAFQTLVNAAAAQQSLIVPGKEGHPNQDRRNVMGGIKMEMKGTKDDVRQTEGFERTLLDIHNRPRPGGEPPQPRVDQRDAQRWPEDRESMIDRAQRVRQIFATGPPNAEAQYKAEMKKREMDNARNLEIIARDRALLAPDNAGRGPGQHNSSLRISGAHGEPFTKEHFEREMRHPEPKRGLDPFTKQTLEEAREAQLQEHFRVNRQQQLAENEASRIFSHGFQKDQQLPKPGSNAPGRPFTAANLIDAIITHQINITADGTGGGRGSAPAPAPPKSGNSAGMDAMFDRYREKGLKEDVVDVSGSPGQERMSKERMSESPRQSHKPPSNNLTLGDHIATIISQRYSDETRGDDARHAQASDQNRGAPHFQGNPGPHLQAHFMPHDARARIPSPARPLEGIAASVASGPQQDAARQAADASSWKLRRALQQEKEPDERQIIRVSQEQPENVQDMSKPRSQAGPPISHPVRGRTPTGAPGHEPISPPSNRPKDADARKTWLPGPYNSGPGARVASSPSALASQMGPMSGSPPSASATSRPPSQPASLPSASPLEVVKDYMTNRIVEVMRTSDNDENRRQNVEHPDRARSIDGGHASRPSSRDSIASKGHSHSPSPAASLHEGLASHRSSRSSTGDEPPGVLVQIYKNYPTSEPPPAQSSGTVREAPRGSSPSFPRKRMRLSQAESSSDGSVVQRFDSPSPRGATAQIPSSASADLTEKTSDSQNGITSSDMNGLRTREPDASCSADSPSSPGEMVIDESRGPTPSSSSPGPPAPSRSDSVGSRPSSSHVSTSDSSLRDHEGPNQSHSISSSVNRSSPAVPAVSASSLASTDRGRGSPGFAAAVSSASAVHPQVARPGTDGSAGNSAFASSGGGIGGGSLSSRIVIRPYNYSYAAPSIANASKLSMSPGASVSPASASPAPDSVVPPSQNVQSSAVSGSSTKSNAQATGSASGPQYEPLSDDE